MEKFVDRLIIFLVILIGGAPEMKGSDFISTMRSGGVNLNTKPKKDFVCLRDQEITF